MSKNVENNKDGGILSQEAGLPKPESFKVFLYNPKTGAVLGRTAGSWLKIIIFYLTFYLFLGAFFGLAMWMFMQTINDDGPKYYLDDSIIGTSPGLGFRPLSMEHEGSTLIWYNASSKNNHKNWTMNLETFLEDYKNRANNSNVVECDYGNKPGHNEVCDVEVNKWYPCTSENNFDFVNGRPCVFIKLNKILKWEPDYYKSVKDLPSQMPNDLREHIEKVAKTNSKILNTVWVSCEGQYPADKEFLGTVEYFPQQGFPGYYYPFLGTKTYLSPLVAVHFENITRNVLVSVECKAWAHNIVHNRRDRIGLVHFQLLVD